MAANEGSCTSVWRMSGQAPSERGGDDLQRVLCGIRTKEAGHGVTQAGGDPKIGVAWSMVTTHRVSIWSLWVALSCAARGKIVTACHK